MIRTGRKRNACRDLVGTTEGRELFGRGIFYRNIMLRLILQKYK